MSLSGGLALAASFPSWELSGLAWLGPGLILAGAQLRPCSAFGLGYAAGFCLHLCTLSWLLLIPFPAGAFAGWLALSAYLALFNGAWVLFCARLLAPLDKPEGNPPSVGDLFSPFDSARVRIWWPLAAGFSWVAAELVQARFLTGFPWNLLGVSQFRAIALIQIAAVTGVYGLSFLVAWLSAALFTAFAVWMRRGARQALFVLALPAAGMALCFVYGASRLSGTLRLNPEGEKLTIALVQPSIPQTLVFDRAQDEARLQRLVQLTERAVATHPQLLVWPEAAVPGLLRYDAVVFSALTNLIIRAGCWMIVGADDTELSGPDRTGPRVYFNSSFLFSPRASVEAVYRKRRLVIFGEYVPFAEAFPILRRLTPIEGEFKSGPGPVPFDLADRGIRIQTLICFEDNFPHLAREYRDERTRLLLNLTNNGWFGEGAAQWQHAANAIFRAIENGVPLVRCTNNGLTCWVDSQGRLHDVFADASQSIYGEGFEIISVPVPPARETIYHRYGDWFAWSCLGLTAAALLRLQWSRSRVGARP